MSNLSQEEIDAMLNGTVPPVKDNTADAGGQAAASAAEESFRPDPEDRATDADVLDEEMLLLDKSAQYLTSEEIDVLGEVGNICMGAAATTMYTLLGHRTTITTPKVCVYTAEEVLSIYQSPFVVATVEYSKAMTGKNLLILKERDSILITDLLMGGSGGSSLDDVQLDEIHLSAMGEIMNQMIGSSATSLSNMLGKPIDITPPKAVRISVGADVKDLLGDSDLVIKVSFDMEIEGVLKSKLMQIMPIEVGKQLSAALMRPETEPEKSPVSQRKSEETKMNIPADKPPEEKEGASSAGRKQSAREEPARPVRVTPCSFQSFDEGGSDSKASFSSSIDLISDIPLQVSVELGKTKKSISDILNMGIGSVIVLDKMAGELVEVVVNGKRVARGEVVVIDENYGVRITDIIMNRDRVYPQ